MLPRESVPLGRGGVLPIATGRLHGNVFVKRLLLFSRAVFADWFGTANGRVVEEHSLFWDGEWRGLVFWNAKRFVAETETEQTTKETPKHQIEPAGNAGGVGIVFLCW